MDSEADHDRTDLPPQNKHDVAKLLLGRSADPNAAAADGRTPLFYCAQSNAVECARLLLDAGAKLNGVTERSKALTPLHFAAWKARQRTINNA